MFIKKSKEGFCTISVYVDDLVSLELHKRYMIQSYHLKTECKMQDLVETKHCLSLELECIPSGILVHQSTFIQKIVESSTWISHIH